MMTAEEEDETVADCEEAPSSFRRRIEFVVENELETNHHHSHTTSLPDHRKKPTRPPPMRLGLIALILLAQLTTSSSSTPIENVFQNPLGKDQPFQHMVVDRSSARIYVGGVNRLYELDPMLLKRKEVETGPQDDSPECPDRGTCSTERRRTNSYNKALAIFRNMSKLVECDSLFQGRCRLRDLFDISRVGEDSPPIVANSRNASTIVFVAPGPPDPTVDHVLYVASTFTDYGSYRDEVPAVASLSLNKSTRFKGAHRTINSETRMSVERSQRKSYLIDYVASFTASNFSYFVTRQPNVSSGESNHISKLVRLCHGDEFYYSYTEIPIRCGKYGDDYNLVQDAYLAKPGFELATRMGISSTDDYVLYAVFARGGEPLRRRPTSQSALCVYSVRDIDKIFLENIERCNRGNAIRGLAYFKPSGDCNPTQFPPGYDISCGSEVNYPLGGNIPIVRDPVWTSTNRRLTSVTASSVHTHSIAFIGTSDGSVVKIVVESENKAFEYETVEVSRTRSPILQDMDLDTSGEYLIVITADTVSKVKVHNCQQDLRCTGCLERKDPYCGWCSLENRCSIKSECTLQTHWLSYQNSECTSIREVKPNKVQITRTKYLNITIDNLPAIQGRQLSCVFTILGRSLTTGASHDIDRNDPRKGYVNCHTPQTSVLPQIPADHHSIASKLSVQIDPNGPDFATTEITFFDCSSFKSCSACVESDFPCDWCVNSHQCTSNFEDACRAEHIVNGIKREGQSRRRGSKFCPAIKSDVSDIYVHSGTTTQIKVYTNNLQAFQDQFTCEFKIDYSVHRKQATLVDNEIVCDPMEFVYFDQTGNGTKIAQFSVLWNKGKAFDNPDNIRIVMYKCDQLADNCGKCLSLERSKFSCGWCLNDNSCDTEAACGKSGWLLDEMCPNPKILDFTPKSGPIEGGTMVTITGINLGRSFSDIQDAIRISNVLCEPIRGEYEIASKIVCRTGQPAHNKVSSGPVIVRLKEDMSYVAISDGSFHYVDPVITGFTPQKGPLSGGTEVSVRGTHLDAGSSAVAQIAELNCVILTRSQGELRCRTTEASTPKQGGIKIIFDDTSRRDFANTQFDYRTDPIITSIRPERSIVSGGVLIEARGDRFNLTQKAHMILTLESANSTGEPCKIMSNERMECPAPALPSRLRNRRDLDEMNEPISVDYGFQLDGVEIMNLASKTGFNPFLIFPDPELEQFSGESRTKFYKGENDYMTINGNNMDLAASEEDVSIRIGAEWCNLTALASKALTCRPPTENPGTLRPSSPHPEVIVKIGNREYLIGYLSYENQENSFFGGIPMDAIIAIAVAVTVFVVAIAILLVAYRRKSTRHDRQMKNLKAQMDTIEMKVASECKEAFAELQTSMNEMAADMAVGIPFLSYREYALQVLFPNTVNHPVMQELEVEPHRAVAVEKGLRQFNQLLMNKTFLLLFVRTMEGSKYFLGKDRVYVGSLLMVILQEKMEYCTDILKTLLAELIEKTVERRYQPKILFRRSESVAERMLAAWFTFLMHRYLQECAGQPLFMLYWAIKQQIEKGPVDAVTLEARYSLSEEKLLRSAVEFHPLTVFVVGINGNQQQVETPVRVLDMDTITQVKEKCLDAIYRTTPYSMRPTASDLDLEWRQGVGGRLVLQDLDVSTKTEPGGWKRYNTIHHYNVPNNASLALVHRQASMYNLSLLSERSDKSSTFSLKNSPTLNRAFSPLAGHTGTTGSRGEKDHEAGYKLYHLVKPNDQGMENSQDRPGAKLVSEIYLTRLLTTKGTLQKFTEDLLESIFSTTHRGSTLPLCVKYMFDFMDDQALSHGITDLEVVHTWKSNALPLRFWVNLIKNPQFVFDIPRLAKVEGCLSVVAQTLMDACSTQDHQLTKDSPSSKLLFARDILIYRDWVDKYYQDIRTMPAISDQDMNAFLAEESRSHQQQFYVYSALSELYKYLEQYKDQLAIALEEDEFARRSRLPAKFAQMLRVMEGDLYGTLDGRA